jgi:hypothetical protein
MSAVATNIKPVEASPTELTLHYHVTGATEAQDAINAILSAAPSTYDGYPRLDDSVKVAENIEGVDASWSGTVTYSNPTAITMQPGMPGSTPDRRPRPPLALGEWSMSGGTSVESIVTKHALEHIADFADGSDAVNNYGGAINVQIRNGQIDIQGCQVESPIAEFTIEGVVNSSSFTDYKTVAERLVGRVNSDVFSFLINGVEFEYEAKTLLLVGFRYSPRESWDWHVSWTFKFSPNEDDLIVGDILVGVKAGWHYVWATSKADISGGLLTTVTDGVHIEKVYRESIFSGLLIGEGYGT